MSKGTDKTASMMGYLYGELSEAEEAEFRAALAGDKDLEAELGALQQTRDLLDSAKAQWADEEPPSAVTARLLHEASRTAAAEQRSVWAALVELMQPLLRHPAMASVAGLVVVGGVVGVLASRGNDRVVHPRAASRAPAPASAAQSAPSSAADYAEAAEAAPAGNAGGADEEADGRADGVVGAARPEAAAELAQVASPAPHAQRDRRSKAMASGLGKGEDAVRDESKRPKKESSKESRKARLAGEAEENALFEAAAPAPAKAGKADSVRAQSALSADAPGGRGAASEPPAERAAAPRRFAPPPPAAAPAAEPFGVDVAPQAAAGAAAPSQPAEQPVFRNRGADEQAMKLHRRLEQLLGERKTKSKSADKGPGSCQAAGRLANDILDLNPEYYRARVGTSPAVRACMPYIAAETQRRRKARSKKSSRPATADAAASEEP
jgi:hypothetical protein